MLAIAAVVGACGCVVVNVGEPVEFGGRLLNEVEATRQAMADLRTLGIIFESYHVDYNYYPTSQDPDRDIGGVPLSKIENLATELRTWGGERAIPRRDPWNTPYLFWSDGRNYALVSLGSDGAVTRLGTLADALRLAATDEVGEPVLSHCVEDEIVLVKGTFMCLPRDPLRRCERRQGSRDAGS